MKRDLSNRADVEKLVQHFYELILQDERISFFFTQTVKVDWNSHLPVMYDFWESQLFDKAVYQGNPMNKHFELNKKKQMNPEHFAVWLALWINTVQSLFDGPLANKAIDKARSIALLMEYKIRQREKGF